MKKLFVFVLLIFTTGCVAERDCEGDLICLHTQAMLEALSQCRQRLYEEYGDEVALGLISPISIDASCRNYVFRN